MPKASPQKGNMRDSGGSRRQGHGNGDQSVESKLADGGGANGTRAETKHLPECSSEAERAPQTQARGGEGRSTCVS